MWKNIHSQLTGAKTNNNMLKPQTNNNMLKPKIRVASRLNQLAEPLFLRTKVVRNEFIELQKRILRRKGEKLVIYQYFIWAKYMCVPPKNKTHLHMHVCTTDSYCGKTLTPHMPTTSPALSLHQLKSTFHYIIVWIGYYTIKILVHSYQNNQFLKKRNLSAFLFTQPN